MPLLEVRNVRKVYKARLIDAGVEALRNVSFSVEQGEFVAIMGESGSGKTTLLNILAALDTPTSGQVLLRGVDFSRMREKWRHRTGTSGKAGRGASVRNIVLYPRLAARSFRLNAQSIGGGLVLGIAFSQDFLLLFRVLMQVDMPIGFEVPRVAVIYTVLVYAAILLMNLVANLGRVSLAKPIGMLRETDSGDREPHARVLVTACGLLALVGGYAMSFLTNPLESLWHFLVAVILVIMATYCLFSSGSVALLKALRANKAYYYYQPRHFFAVAGMLHRMRRNAAGLATVCVLSTMTLVTASTTLAMYMGAGVVAMQAGDEELRSVMCAYFFVGLFLSILFFLATTLTIYYKLVSEGHEDSRSFSVMRQVGMTEEEVWGTMRGQASLTFLPPLIVASCHMVAALPMTGRILMAFGITDSMLVALCAGVTLLCYGAVYLLVYWLAARAYHRIVSK